MLADDIGLDPAANQRGQILVGGGRLDGGELAVGQVAQPRAEPEAQHGAENEHMVRGAAGVGVMRPDPQSGAMMHQPVQHIGRLVAGRRHDAHAVGPVLVGNMGVEAQAGIVAVAGVHLAGGVAALGRAEELPVGGRGGAVTPGATRLAGRGGRR